LGNHQTADAVALVDGLADARHATREGERP
jgi:hypothetical protein